jgi:type II secretory pathway pseudopilin PulG
MPCFPSPRAHKTRAFTLIDVLGSVALIGIGLAAVMSANSRAMIMFKSTKQAAVASKCLQQRIEQMRTYNWTQITDSQAMQDLYAVPPLPSVELPGFSEQVTVSAFVPATSSEITSPAPVAPFIQITRASNGTVTLVSDNGNLTDGAAVRVDVQITWPGPGGSTRMRETSVVIANGGVGR